MVRKCLRRLPLMLAAGLTLSVGVQASEGGKAPVVKTEAGWVEGVAGHHDDVSVFKGLPCAAPPVGELFGRPIPVAASKARIDFWRRFYASQTAW
jgi:hypothetical protein